MTYKVKRGDTLAKIAQKYDTTVEALVASNGIKDKNKIYVGQVLQIPAKATKPTTTDRELKKAFNSCIAVIENLAEYKKLVKLLEE